MFPSRISSGLFTKTPKAAAGGYSANGTFFAGGGQCRIELDSTGTGVTDSATGTISLFLDPTGSNTDDWRVLGTNSRFRLARGGGDDSLRFNGVGTTGTDLIDIRQDTGIVAALTATSGWSWVGICFDNNTVGACYFFIANAATLWVATDCSNRADDTGGGAVIDLTDGDWSVGDTPGGTGAGMVANISEPYVSQSFIDLSLSANRDLFYNPTTHGPAGDLSAVGSPIIYLPNPFGTFINNVGSAGNFTKYGTTALADGGPIP